MVVGIRIPFYVKMINVEEIPLLPLNTVIFPHTPVQLHIFEPRYLQMVNDCLKEDQRFGIALILNGMEALGPLAEPHPIGCSAQIVQIEHLSNGHINLTALGKSRFRILDLDRESKPYLIARIKPYPLEKKDPAEVAQKAAVLRGQFGRFIKILLETGANQMDLSQLPEDDLGLAYLAAAVLQISPLQKQELLAMQDGEALIDRLRSHYQRELALLDVVRLEKNELQPGGFSLN
jgi:Lon protease-like protein